MKNIFIIVFSTIFISLVTAGSPLYEVSIINTRKQAVFIDADIYPELVVQNDWEKHYSLKYSGIWFGEVVLNNIKNLKLLPQGNYPCYSYTIHRFDPYASEKNAFLKLEVYDQFKLVYKEFTVRDEKGNILLDLNTIQPKYFIAMKSQFSYYLMIK